ncbi:MAG TPA: hypothetical protein ENH40_05695 [Nitrospirae bacterium]|nr:hypothetical protein [Nitrospirota bacterium]
MAKIKSASEIAEKWARVTPQRAPDYEAGIKSPRVDWAIATKAAEDAYKAGVIKAANEGRFGKGVTKAGTAKWQEKTLAVGPARYSQGVSIAGPAYEKGFAPFRDIIEKTTLPPRFSKGDPRNIERVKVMAEALHKGK